MTEIKMPDVGDLVAVDWDDTTNVAAWLTQQEVTEFAGDGVWHCQNVGYVTHIDDDCLIVSARKSQEGHWGLNERIPRVTITGISAVEVPSEERLVTRQSLREEFADLQEIKRLAGEAVAPDHPFLCMSPQIVTVGTGPRWCARRSRCGGCPQCALASALAMPDESKAL